MAQPKKYQHVKRIKTSKITIFQLVMKLTIILVWFCSSKEIRGKENRAKNDSLYVSNGIYKQSKYSIIKQKKSNQKDDPYSPSILKLLSHICIKQTRLITSS